MEEETPGGQEKALEDEVTPQGPIDEMETPDDQQIKDEEEAILGQNQDLFSQQPKPESDKDRIENLQIELMMKTTLMEYKLNKLEEKSTKQEEEFTALSEAFSDNGKKLEDALKRIEIFEKSIIETE